VREVEARAAELEVSFTDLEQLRVIGAGMFGQVKMVKHRFTGCIYALKTMRKDQIVRHGQQVRLKHSYYQYQSVIQ
jgi:serine/threonine protein kinase